MQLDDGSPPTIAHEILPPYDDGELMWAGASYVFWPLLPGPLLLTARREEPFLRFHFIQALLFGVLSTVGFAVFTLVVVYVYRSAGTPDGVGMGMLYVSMFGVWLLGLLFYFAWFMIFAWRAGRGDVFKVFLIGPLIAHWVIGGMQGME